MTNWIPEVSHASNGVEDSTFLRPPEAVDVSQDLPTAEAGFALFGRRTFSRIFNQCQLFSKGHEQNLTRKHNY